MFWQQKHFGPKGQKFQGQGQGQPGHKGHFSQGPNCKVAANVEKRETCHSSIFWLQKHFGPKGQKIQGQGQGHPGHKGHLAIRSHIYAFRRPRSLVLVSK